MLEIAEEIWIQIFSWLSQSDILSLTLTSKEWKRLAYDNFFWLQFYSERFGTKRALNLNDDQTAKELFQQKSRLSAHWKDHQYTTTEIKVGRKQVLSVVHCERYDVIISGLADKTIRMHDLTSQQEIVTLRHPRGPVNCIQVDSHKMIAASDHTDLILYDFPSARFVKRFRCHSGPIYDACMHDNTAITGSRDTQVGIWDLRQCSNVSQLRGHSDSVTSLWWDGGNQILSGGSDKIIKEWDIRTGQCIRDIRHHSMPVRCIIKKDGTILSGGEDRALIETDYTTGNLIASIACPQYVLSLLDSEYGLLHNTSDGIQVRSPGDEWRIPYSDGWFATLDMDSQNKRIFAGSSDGSVQIYNFDGQ
eukprot:TRINITY_DN9120_c0_g1_i1.p1 TRINITY_DN9120_c0_g1~~TRINITY_DN9120_c0_g1_i1.p1  ORF type:complete len:362 (+),score=63.16 TRINITY_DN9120_c0_g1_i1:72-1157(+)